MHISFILEIVEHQQSESPSQNNVFVMCEHEPNWISSKRNSKKINETHVCMPISTTQVLFRLGEQKISPQLVAKFSFAHIDGRKMVRRNSAFGNTAMSKISTNICRRIANT